MRSWFRCLLKYRNICFCDAVMNNTAMGGQFIRTIYSRYAGPRAVGPWVMRSQARSRRRQAQLRCAVCPLAFWVCCL